MNLKCISERNGRHVHTRFFAAAKADGTYELLGTLITDLGEWQAIGAALRIGSDTMRGHLAVELLWGGQTLREFKPADVPILDPVVADALSADFLPRPSEPR